MNDPPLLAGQQRQESISGNSGLDTSGPEYPYPLFRLMLVSDR